MWNGLALADPVRRKTVGRVASHLHALLDRSGLLAPWFPRCELLLWMLVTGACVADPARHSGWFAVRVAKVCAHLGVLTEAALKLRLARWFYIDECQGADVARLFAIGRRGGAHGGTDVRYHNLDTRRDGCSENPGPHGWE